MSALIPFLVIDQTCDRVEPWVEQQLTEAGFRVMQTFDLQAVRLAHADCTCPHHGTDRCNCQMGVFLVYGKQAGPATLVIHGQDGKTWLSLANPTRQRAEQHLEAIIKRVLIPRCYDLSSPGEVADEARSTV